MFKRWSDVAYVLVPFVLCLGIAAILCCTDTTAESTQRAPVASHRCAHRVWCVRVEYNDSTSVVYKGRSDIQDGVLYISNRRYLDTLTALPLINVRVVKRYYCEEGDCQ